MPGSTTVRIKSFFTGVTYDVRCSMVHEILGIRAAPAAGGRADSDRGPRQGRNFGEKL